MLSPIEKWKLYISSYIPLYFLILIKEYNQFFDTLVNINRPKLPSIFVYVTSFFLIYSLCIIRKNFFGKSTETFTVSEKYETVTDSVMNYVMTYIIPMISIDFSQPITVITNFLLFVFIGIIYVKNDLIYLNPLISIRRNIFLSDDKIVISKFTQGELKRFKKENIKVVGKKLSSNVLIYQDKKKWAIKIA